MNIEAFESLLIRPACGLVLSHPENSVASLHAVLWLRMYGRKFSDYLTMERGDSLAQFYHARSVIMKEDEFSSLDATYSPQQEARRQWQPPLPKALWGMVRAVPDISVDVPDLPDKDKLLTLFPNTLPNSRIVRLEADESGPSVKPLRVGVVLSGGQAPGGHNVIAGVFDAIKSWNPQSQLIGFLNGPHGVFTHNYTNITEEMMATYRNMGGFDMICSGRHKIETEEQKQGSMEVCRKLDLHGLIIIGGDDSNTNGAILAEYFAANGCKTCVVGVPKTIDGDLRNEYIETSFGFDTACKVYSELIGNISCDVATSQDRYHFVRLMGRSASHIALECAVQTRANLTFIGEEVQAQRRSLRSITNEIADMVVKRNELGKGYGLILVPEGLVEFIPELGELIREMNEILAKGSFTRSQLSDKAGSLFDSLPETIRDTLLMERDAHGNVQVSRIATEKLLIEMVQSELQDRNFTGPFIPTSHFFGYEGRCAMPSNFDATYCYALGYTASALVQQGLSNYMAVVSDLTKAPVSWRPAGCPITWMMNLERRHGKDVPVIRKYMVDLKGKLYEDWARVRQDWMYKDLYRNPGPIQFMGPSANVLNNTLSPHHDSLLPFVEPSHCHFPKSLDCLSMLQKERIGHRVPVASILRNPKARATIAKKCNFSDAQAERFIRRAYPLQTDAHGNRAYVVEGTAGTARVSDLRVGVVLCGQAVPGIANVVQGLFERMALIGGRVIGFKGIKGLLEGDYLVIEREHLTLYGNQGGFELLGRTPAERTAFRKDEGLDKAAGMCKRLGLSGLVLIGGKFSLTDAANMSEFFMAHGVETRVVGVPANCENNVRHPLLELSIGFDSTSKAYSALIGNLLTDAASARKYWYFVRVMGNVTSHLVLEAALQTHPNMAVISEKHVEDNRSIMDIVRDIADCVERRAANGKSFGTVLIPEGLLTCLPQMKALLNEIDGMLQHEKDYPTIRESVIANEFAHLKFTPWSAALLKTLPAFFRAQLVARTPSGRMEVSELSAEQLLAEWVGAELNTRKAAGSYKGTFSPVCHYLGFQGRCTMPSDFDCALGVAHGYLAGIVIESELSGFVTSVRGLCGKPTDWRFTAVPLTAFTRVMPDAEERIFGRRVPIVPGHEVDLQGSCYRALTIGQEQWELNDACCNPGPIQFSGHSASIYNRTLFEEQYEYMEMLERLDSLTGYVGGVCSFGVNKDTLTTAVVSLKALVDIISDGQIARGFTPNRWAV